MSLDRTCPSAILLCPQFKHSHQETEHLGSETLLGPTQASQGPSVL